MPSGATFSVTGSSTKYLTASHILNNAGAGTWAGAGEFDGSPGSTFNNAGTFTAQSDTNFSNGGQGAGVIFNNSGTFTKSGTAGTTSFNGNLLNNSGTVDVDSGTLSLNAASQTQLETGTFNVAAGSVLDFDSNIDGVNEGRVELNAGTQLLGSGLYELDLGTISVDTDLSVTNFTMTGGKLNGPNTLTITQAFDWTGGDVDGAGTTSVASGAAFSVAGSSTKYLTGSHILNNAGVGTWAGTGEFDGSPGSTFNNAGTFTAQSDTNFSNGGYGAGVIFNNSGTFTKSGTSGTTSFIGNLLNNSGTVDVDSGTLSLNAAAATQIETGTFNVASGATLDFVSNIDTVSEGDVKLNAGTQLLGSGLYELDLGTISVDTDLSVTNFTMTGGTLNGPDTLTITGAFNWTGGDLDGAGTISVASGATLNISGSNLKSLTNDYNLTNQGTAIWPWTGQINGNNGSILNNTGTFTTEGNATLSGIIVTNSGSLIVGPASTLDVSGSYTQTSKGEFTTEISGEPATGSFGVLASTGSVALDGTLTISLVDGYSPTAGSNFTVMTYPSETGDFRTIDHGDAGQGQFWSESTNSTDVAVTAAIDAGPPTSSVVPLPATEASTSFTVAWSGHDDTGGPGIASYAVYVSDNGGPFAAFQADTTATSATFTGVNGHAYGFYSIATDSAGDVQSTPTAAQATTEIDLPPAPPQPSPPVLVAADDSGTPGDDITDDATLAFSGTTDPGATVQLLSGKQVIGTASADSSGNYTVAVRSPLSPNAFTFTVVASNVDGSSPASNPFTLTIVAVPTTPTAPMLLAASDSGTKGDGFTDDASPSLTGTAFGGATVQLLNSGGIVIATGTAGSAGSYVIPIAGPLSPQAYDYRVQTIDKYGDNSSPSAAFSLTVVAPPPTPGAPTLLPADSNASPGGETTTSTSPHLIGTTIAGATVQLLGPGGTILNTALASGAGNYEIQVPGLIGVGAHTYQVDAIDQYGDVSSPSPAQTITVVNTTPPPPQLVTVESLQVEKIKVGKGKKAPKETVLVLQFSGALNAAAADNVNAYELASVITVKATGKGKHKQPPTTKLGKPVTPAKAVYTASNNEVTLTPRGTLNLTKPEELIVDAVLVTDTLGREIDGNDDGQPGGDYIATINGTRVTPGGLPLARSLPQPAIVEDAIDDLLARGELADLTRALRARREGRTRGNELR